MTTLQKSRAPAVEKPQHDPIAEELEAKIVVQLPEREALSVAFPLAGPLSGAGVTKGAQAVADALDDVVIGPDS